MATNSGDKRKNETRHKAVPKKREADIRVEPRRLQTGVMEKPGAVYAAPTTSRSAASKPRVSSSVPIVIRNA
jgi:hypothetical protein